MDDFYKYRNLDDRGGIVNFIIQNNTKKKKKKKAKQEEARQAKEAAISGIK